ncbi:hypothetical protein M406DRAFT_330382 [Cryphonectria parasitica EP155]|uniref:Uncharacterized protein n=1 Tax=Cryphonectria parasitica (strain ATCC 38755 / EP155) TaxID=660469 RepID=A0A9P5CQM0_CRYP1|nr:uncharacterized protein M406DRAFT_330382 [Cryphonectria parasitica EP155]KAF3766577.1 hypothetical protein M406DRAFT_330382 [Cryphonectria parasitica EP155]
MAPLEPVSSERMNKQIGSTSPSKRDSTISAHGGMSPSRHGGHSRDSSVSDKINQFNTLAAVQNNKLERKAADAALKRAALGREAAEEEARRYKDEVRALRKQVEEGKERERRVGERLETVMESYGRAKETHAHTQALWEKEIRRTRKETFKSQSVIVKLQEELKSARAAQKSAEETLQREKERSLSREQEAFQARYNLVGLQEQLDKGRSELEQALERIKVVEQERDAFKTLAKTEEDVARIAAEGRLPLPASNMEDEDDEFASPSKTGSRVSSLSLVEVRSSAASEAEIEELSRLWQWEKQRADRANDHIEYLEAECRLHACSCMKKRPRSSMALLSPKRQKRGEPAPLADPSDRMILSEKATIPPPRETSAHSVPQPAKPRRNEHKEERRATIFLPDLGTFQTVFAEEAEAIERNRKGEKMSGRRQLEDNDMTMEDAPAPRTEGRQMPERYSRTPSVEPPSFAVVGPERASLASLLSASHQQMAPVAEVNAPTTLDSRAPSVVEVKKITMAKTRGEGFSRSQPARTPLQVQDPNVEMAQGEQYPFKASFGSRPHTTTSFYQTSTTTTTIPLREETSEPSMAQKLLALQRTPSRGRVADDSAPSWDVNNPALTPTMTREQALAKIRERRGRAKSGAAATPHKSMMRGVQRREMSAPAGRKGRLGS